MELRRSVYITVSGGGRRLINEQDDSCENVLLYDMEAGPGFIKNRLEPTPDPHSRIPPVQHLQQHPQRHHPINCKKKGSSNDHNSTTTLPASTTTTTTHNACISNSGGAVARFSVPANTPNDGVFWRNPGVNQSSCRYPPSLCLRTLHKNLPSCCFLLPPWLHGLPRHAIRAAAYLTCV